MKIHVLVFVLLFACIYLSLAQGSYGNCCLGYVKEIKRKRYIIGYTMQEPDGDCNMRAVLFTMKKKTRVCANPDENWVKAEMKRLDQEKKH